MKNNLGNKIKNIRDKYRLTQDRFGKKIGLSGKTISAYETGRCLPPLRILDEISRVYDESFLQIKDSKKEDLIEKLSSVKNAISDFEEVLSKDLVF